MANCQPLHSAQTYVKFNVFYCNSNVLSRSKASPRYMFNKSYAANEIVALMFHRTIPSRILVSTAWIVVCRIDGIR